MWPSIARAVSAVLADQPFPGNWKSTPCLPVRWFAGGIRRMGYVNRGSELRVIRTSKRFAAGLSAQSRGTRYYGGSNRRDLGKCFETLVAGSTFYKAWIDLLNNRLYGVRTIGLIAQITVGDNRLQSKSARTMT